MSREDNKEAWQHFLLREYLESPAPQFEGSQLEKYKKQTPLNEKMRSFCLEEGPSRRTCLDLSGGYLNNKDFDLFQQTLTKNPRLNKGLTAINLSKNPNLMTKPQQSKRGAGKRPVPPTIYSMSQSLTNLIQKFPSLHKIDLTETSITEKTKEEV